MRSIVSGKKNNRKIKNENLQKLKKLPPYHPPVLEREWFRTWEVLNMLQVSKGTLQNFRKNGTIGYSKVGGMLFYHVDDIQNIAKKRNVQ